MADGAASKAHSALTVSANVKALIPIILDKEGPYQSWVTLFKVQAQAHDVLHHIIPPTETTEKAACAKAKAENLPLWKRLDAAVLQWMYATVTNDILLRILKDDDTAADAWIRIAGLFQDNRNSRAMYLNKEFANTTLRDFPDTSAYCSHLKLLADQLAGVGDPMTEKALVLKLLAGLTKPYRHFVTVMHNMEPFPGFDSIRSKIALQETTLLESNKSDDESASIHTHRSSRSTGDRQTPSPPRRHSGGSQTNSGKHGKKGKNKHGGGNYPQQSGGGNQSRHGGSSSARYQQQQQPNYQQGQPPYPGHQQSARQMWSQPPPWWWYSAGPWGAPPAPYPVQQGTRPIGNSRGGVSGNSKGGSGNGAYMAEEGDAEQWIPTTMDQAFNAMQLNPPPQPWIMDTGATSHMSNTTDRNPPNEM